MSFRSIKTDATTCCLFPGRRTAPSRLHRRRRCLPVLIVLHQETSTPGRVGNALRALGYPLDIRRPRFGDPLPETLDQSCRRGHFRRPDERQRSGRLRPPRDRLDRGSAAGAAAVSGHLPGRADACQAIRRAGSRRIPKAARRSAIIRSARRRRDMRSARTGRITSTTGTARDFELPRGAELLAEGERLSGAGVPARPRVRLPVSSRRDLRDDASLDHARLRPPRSAGRAAAPPSLRRPRGARRDRAGLAEAFHRGLAGACAPLSVDGWTPPNSRHAEFAARVRNVFQILQM